MKDITPGDMERLQTDNYNLKAEMARPPLMRYTDEALLNSNEKKYLDIFYAWNLRNDGSETGPAIFDVWWDSLKYCMYHDEFAQTDLNLPDVADETLLRALRKDSAYTFADDITTPQKETMRDIVTLAFKKAVPALEKAEKNGNLVWGKFKNSSIRHLLRLPSFSRLHIFSGGGAGIINAYTQVHGPSWRMIVQLTDETEAYGLYPGGQSGNPGSKYYDTFIDKWVAGQYYPIHIFKKSEIQKQQNLLGVLSFSR
jgi:penicillin amidase